MTWQVEAEGRLAQQEALHQKALAEAAEEASKAGSTNEKRLATLATSQVRSPRDFHPTLFFFVTLKQYEVGPK